GLPGHEALSAGHGQGARQPGSVLFRAYGTGGIKSSWGRNRRPQRSFSLGFSEQGVRSMLGWALAFLIIAVIAGVLGFSGIAGAASSIAQILFFVFLAAMVIGLILGLGRRAR